ncbi:MAG: HAMP domain-containing histidine kinase [Thiobacillaceae bacterium]|jgi:signal transduction histidine kinase|nr:HAMP domain-containing histidine kinase [Thiobacillaceae bacterium]
MKFETTDLFAALLHEMKNNLALLSMTLDGLKQTDDSEQAEQLYTARLLCQRVIDRLSQSLLLYKKDQQRFVLNVDANATVDFVRELAKTAASLAGGRFEIEASIDDDVPALWFFDRNMVEMAMITAMHNSLSYAARKIEIGASLLDGRLCLTVKDDSDGFPDHILACLAEDRPFSAKGTGLGLTFARLIAEAHDNQGRTGELRLANERGAVFNLLLP